MTKTMNETKNEKIKRTIRELLEIDSTVAGLYANDKTLEKSKFGYAYKRFYEKNITSIQKKSNEKMLEARINNALEDKTTKEVLTDPASPRGFKYSKDGLKKCIEEERNIMEEFNDTEVEIEPYISPFVPKMSDEEKELLRGLVI